MIKQVLIALTLAATAAHAEIEVQQGLDVVCTEGGKTLYSGPAKLTFPKKGGVTIKTPDENRFTFKSFDLCTVKPRDVKVQKAKQVY